MGDGDRARAPGVDARRADAPSAPNPARALALAIDDAAIPRQPARRLRRWRKPSLSFFLQTSFAAADRSSKTTTRLGDADDLSAGVLSRCAIQSCVRRVSLVRARASLRRARSRGEI
jgi:hypothetical protein